MTGQMQISKNPQIRFVSVCLCITHHPLIKDGSRIIRFLLSCNLAPSSPSLMAKQREERTRQREGVSNSVHCRGDCLVEVTMCYFYLQINTTLRIEPISLMCAVVHYFYVSTSICMQLAVRGALYFPAAPIMLDNKGRHFGPKFSHSFCGLSTHGTHPTHHTRTQASIIVSFQTRVYDWLIFDACIFWTSLRG